MIGHREGAWGRPWFHTRPLLVYADPAYPDPLGRLVALALAQQANQASSAQAMPPGSRKPVVMTCWCDLPRK